ncbi:MAG: D-isomer specific 2-hydroxyacid dehydrogenase family protein [Gammaproteobacteria bacterium]|nr:D-isomer specific 2-hydroxyacid dehydrogenase family protein [Gammaproteobacteria bacterium]MCI0591341.1 D-isomer specific 2-hydroxyacid dehydrogenase family protein [Gammaproteobacteria bacterium]
MPRPRALYYTILNFMPNNLLVLSKQFNVTQLPDPGADTDEILANLDLCFAPLGYPFDAAKMQRCPKLKAIVTNTTGVPHIDMPMAAARGMRIFSLKDEQAFLRTITATAEHTWGLLLALLRRTPWGFQAVLGGEWNRFDFGAPAMLSRLSLGIVGLGRLGSMVARYGAAFGMHVHYYDPYVEPPADGPKRKETIEDLIAASDVLTLHAPSNKETRHVINRDVINRCKPGAIIINTSRGELIDEMALLDALQEKRLAGAALDVLDDEYSPRFRPADHPLVHYARQHDNLLITPHIGGSSLDAWNETQRRVIDMATAYFKEMDRR